MGEAGRGLRIGLVGCGHWGRLILRDLCSSGCEVLVSTRSDENQAAAREGGASSVVAVLDDLPADLDGVVVATPTATHAAVVEAALGRGVPVFVEKPMTADVTSATRLAALAPDRLFVMDKWRYHPGIEALGAIARSGELGALRSLRGTRVQWGNPHADVDGIWILAPHELAIALEILGAVPVPRAAAPIGAPDAPGGVVALATLGGIDVVIEVSTVSTETRRRTELVCDGGVAVLAGGWDTSITVARADGDGTPESRPVSNEMPLLRELEAFVAHLAGGPAPRSSAAEGAAIVAATAELRKLAGIDTKVDTT